VFRIAKTTSGGSGTATRSQEGRSWKTLYKAAALLIAIWALDAFGNLFVHAVQLTPTSMAYDLVTAAAMAAFLAWLVPKVHLKLESLAMMLWMLLFAVEYMINYIEALFFTTMFGGSYLSFVMALVRAAVSSGVVAALAAFVLGGRRDFAGVWGSLDAYFSERTRRSWALRIAAASLAYFPIYFFFGMIVSPFVLPYYSNPVDGLVIPQFGVMAPVELLRGFLYVLVLLPLIAVLRTGKNLSFAALAAMLYIPGGFVALFGNSLLPPPIVPFHAAEILADSIVYGFALSRILQGRSPAMGLPSGE